MKLKFSKEDKDLSRISNQVPFGSYVYVRVDELIMSRMIGRPLEVGEIVEHLNRDKSDNRRKNLGLLVARKKLVKRKTSVNNTSGINGVSFCSKTGRWLATIKVNGRLYSLGRFDSKEEAAKARLKAERRVFE